jgi:predicted AlkP superfamily phosphohydrolase/phosphomutase
VAAPVVAIGLDAAPLPLIQRWIAQGRLPAMARLFEQGARAPLATVETYVAELTWPSFITGVTAARTGWWSPVEYDPGRYRVSEASAYDCREFPPFYARSQGLRAVVFDLPQSPLVAGLPGVQIRGWGVHAQMTPSGSQPDGLLAELEARHGVHPMEGRDHAEPWDCASLSRLRGTLLEGVRRRVRIGCELLARERFDLFLAVFAEPHVAGHCFWHLSQSDHPHWQERPETDPILEVLEAIDAGLAELFAAAPPGSRQVLFSLHGMQANELDLPSMVFLPELLYRASAPGRFGLAKGTVGAPLPDRAPAQAWSFIDELWTRKHDWNPLRRRARRRGLRASQRAERWLGAGSGPANPRHLSELGHIPAAWYSNLWPSMPAFALPSFAHGQVRVNLRGRDRCGMVEPADYDAVLARVAQRVAQMSNARTGKPLASRVWRSRASAFDSDPRLPAADLVVVWEGGPVEAADCGELGRIGPIPFHRTGSHAPEGFVVATGPGLAPGLHPGGTPLDLGPTLLRLAGAPIPDGLDGAPIPLGSAC